MVTPPEYDRSDVEALEPFQPIESEIEDRQTDVAEYNIIYYGADFTVEVLYKKLKDKEILLPDFQRGYVWPPKKASRLIESFLLGLPVPPIFLYKEEETQSFLVVDGNQRLTTIRSFMDGKFPNGREFYLDTVKSKWEGKSFRSFSEIEKRKLNNSLLRATIFRQIDPKDNSSMFEIFERLNTGGVSLKEQEIRNCIYRGPFNDLLKELNSDKTWRALFGKFEPDKRMRDIELILRFFALYFWSDRYSKPMKQFLSDFMKEKQKITSEDSASYKNLFKECIGIFQDQLGSSAFTHTAGINVALYDSLMLAVASTPNKSLLKKLNEKKDKLLSNKSFVDAISSNTTDKENVEKRIRIAKDVLAK